MDSSYAHAYSGLADSYLAMWALLFHPEREVLPKAQAAAEEALRIDPELAAAHTSLGQFHQIAMRWDEARAAHERALELDPGNAIARQTYGSLLVMVGQAEEGLAQVRRAVELDPLSAQSRTAYAALLLYAREYAAAIEESARTLELEPELDYLHYVQGFAHALSGDVEAGIAAVRRADEINGGEAYSRVGLAYLLAMAGRRAEALEIIEALEGQTPSLREIGLVYGVLGEMDLAFEYLDRAFEEEPASLSFMATDPTADPIRDDPRYEALLNRLGME
ncbi:MAG: tetratricopeptide repeat protein [Gemmatimonadales bacterium]